MYLRAVSPYVHVCVKLDQMQSYEFVDFSQNLLEGGGGCYVVYRII